MDWVCFFVNFSRLEELQFFFENAYRLTFRFLYFLQPGVLQYSGTVQPAATAPSKAVSAPSVSQAAGANAHVLPECM